MMLNRIVSISKHLHTKHLLSTGRLRVGDNLQCCPSPRAASPGGTVFRGQRSLTELLWGSGNETVAPGL